MNPNKIGLLLAIFLPVCVWADHHAIALSPSQIASLGIRLGKPASTEQTPLLYAPATVVIPPSGEYRVSATQAGWVRTVRVAAGDSVKKGQVVAELDSPELLSLQQRYLHANSALQVQQLAYERDKKLFAEGIIAQRRWQESRSLYQASTYSANEHRQLLALAGMTDSAIQRLAHTHQLSGRLPILTPISGVVMEQIAVAGGRVDNLAPLYRIADLTELWLEINVPPERLGELTLGNAVQVIPPSPPPSSVDAPQTALPVTAKLTLLGQTVNPDTQAVQVRASVNNAGQIIKPGQRLNVLLFNQQDGLALRAPNTAIAHHEGRAYVFVHTPTGFLVTAITVIGKHDEYTTFQGAFTGQETIALTGTAALKANWLGLGGGE